MSSIHIPLSGQVPLEELFAGIPAAPKLFIRRGFSVLASLPESARPILLGATVEAAGLRKNRDEVKLASTLGISPDDAAGVTGALGMLSALAASRSEKLEEILQAMISAGLVSAGEKSALMQFIPGLLEVMPAIKKAVAKQGIANAVLPSFDSFQAVLDIRLGDEDEGGYALPVAIAFLGTDSRDHRLWFQLTKADVESLVEELNALLKRFKIAEELAVKFTSIDGED